MEQIQQSHDSNVDDTNAYAHEPALTPHIDSLSEKAPSTEEQVFKANRIRVLYGIARARNPRIFRHLDEVIAERRATKDMYEREQLPPSENTDDVL